MLHIRAYIAQPFEHKIRKGRFVMHSCSHSPHHNPLYCIVPAYMLEQIAQNGTPEQQAWAQQTLSITNVFRHERLALARGETSSSGLAAAVGAIPAVAVKQRSVYTANHGTSLPGTLVRQEGAPASGDAAVDEAYDGAGYTYDLYWNVYQRNSI